MICKLQNAKRNQRSLPPRQRRQNVECLRTYANKIGFGKPVVVVRKRRVRVQQIKFIPKRIPGRTQGGYVDLYLQLYFFLGFLISKAI